MFWSRKHPPWCSRTRKKVSLALENFLLIKNFHYRQFTVFTLWTLIGKTARSNLWSSIAQLWAFLPFFMCGYESISSGCQSSFEMMDSLWLFSLLLSLQGLHFILNSGRSEIKGHRICFNFTCIQWGVWGVLPHKNFERQTLNFLHSGEF